MSTKDLQNFFGQFSNTLQILAREGRHIELRKRLELLSGLLDLWLSVIPEGHDRPQRFKLFVLLYRFNGPLDIDMREIAKQAANSNDESTVQIVVDFASRFASHCLNENQNLLAEEYFESIVSLYYQCGREDSLSDVVGGRLDSILHSLLTSRFYPETKLNSEPDDAAISVFRFVLSLIYASIHLCRPRDAGYFVDRLREIRRHSLNQSANDQNECVTNTVNTVLDYVFVLLIGWSFEVLQSPKSKYHPAARRVLSDAKSQLPSREKLIAEWELLRDSKFGEAILDNRLGVANWDVRDWDVELRSGIMTMRDSRYWPKTGLQAALLSAKSQSWQNVDTLCGTTADRYTWDVNSERASLQKIAAIDILGIPEDQQEQTVEKVLELISIRSRGSDAKHLREVLDADLSENRKQVFKDEAVENWKKTRSWIDVLQELKVGSGDPTLPDARTRGQWISKEYFLDNNSYGSGFGDPLGEWSARSESIGLYYLLEQSATSGENLDALANLPELIRRAIRAMISHGYAPNLVVLPDEDRFAGALFNKPLWKIESKYAFGRATIGDWEGLHVIRCPYSDPTSILLIDTANAIAGSTEPDPEQVSVSFDEDPDHPQAKSKREEARQAIESESAELPDAGDILVLAQMIVNPRLGLSDPSAVLKLSVENSDGGFAITDDSDLYHRPICPDIAYEDVKYVLSAPKASNRKPCPTCHPERWNFESRHGKVDAEPDENGHEI